jgi:hypothetical protein
LYSDLKEKKKSDKFPALYNNHLDLGKSSLLDSKSYGKPDSIIYVDRLKMEYKGKKGFVYFYKYKTKKDDLTWKLATVGLVPEDPKQFEFEDSISKSPLLLNFERIASSRYSLYGFTEFTNTKIKDDEPVDVQLKKMLKKIIYSRRKSAKGFYEEDRNGREVEADYED